jgi:hypothetical protein
MAMLRRRLRIVALTWLVFQVSWLTALVPRECCAAHRPAETGAHESAAPAHCPMRAADGRPCPMHRGHDSDPTAATRHHHDAAPAEHRHDDSARTGERKSSPFDCRLTGGCDGPMAAVFTLLSNHGILPASTATAPNDAAGLVAIAARAGVAGRFQPPDPPPPRA